MQPEQTKCFTSNGCLSGTYRGAGRAHRHWSPLFFRQHKDSARNPLGGRLSFPDPPPSGRENRFGAYKRDRMRGREFREI